MGKRIPQVGDVVIYWGEEGGRLLEQAAIVTALSTDEPTHRVRLHVFFEVGYAGEARLWAQHSGTPFEGRWTFRQTVAAGPPATS
jgi:hypothetical protein